MEEQALRFWCQVEYWYVTEAALILSNIDPRQYGLGRPSKRLLRENHPTAAEWLLVLQRSKLLCHRSEYQPNWKFLIVADSAGALPDGYLRTYLQGKAPAVDAEGLQAAGGRSNPTGRISDRRGGRKQEYEWDNLHKLSALLLAAFLASRNSKLLGQVHNPNVSQIVSELLKFAETTGLDTAGIGRTSMTEKINEAIQRFGDNRIAGAS